MTGRARIIVCTGARPIGYESIGFVRLLVSTQAKQKPLGLVLKSGETTR